MKLTFCGCQLPGEEVATGAHGEEFGGEGYIVLLARGVEPPRCGVCGDIVCVSTDSKLVERFGSVRVWYESESMKICSRFRFQLFLNVRDKRVQIRKEGETAEWKCSMRLSFFEKFSRGCARKKVEEREGQDKQEGANELNSRLNE